MEQDRTYQDVLAENLRGLREEQGLSQPALARRMRGAGWTQATVAAIETRRRAVSLGEALLLQAAFRVPLARLLRADQAEAIDVEGYGVSGQSLRRLAAGDPPAGTLLTKQARRGAGVTLDAAESRRLIKRAERVGGIDRAHPDSPETQVLNMALDARGDAEQKAARRLGVEPFDVAAASHALWDRTLTEERDQRLGTVTGEGKDQRAIAGHVTRKLQEELGSHLRAHGVRRSK